MAGSEHVITVEYRLRAGCEADFMARLRLHGEAALEWEPGCLQFDISVDPADPRHVFLYEVYRDRAAVEAHRETEYLKDFQAAAASLLESRTVTVYHRDRPGAGDGGTAVA